MGAWTLGGFSEQRRPGKSLLKPSYHSADRRCSLIVGRHSGIPLEPYGLEPGATSTGFWAVCGIPGGVAKTLMRVVQGSFYGTGFYGVAPG